MAKTKNDDSPPIGVSADVREAKREDASDRISAAAEEGRIRSFDRDDDFLGWDAQQGGLHSRPVSEEIQSGRRASVYRDDPVRYDERRLPDPEVLREAGFEPVIPRALTNLGDDTEATSHDGGPQTGNVPEADVELKESDSDAPRTVEDARKAEAEKSDSKKKSSKKS